MELAELRVVQIARQVSAVAMQASKAIINHIHEREVANTRERLARLAESMAILSAQPKS